MQKLLSRGTYSLPAPCCSPSSLDPVSLIYQDGFTEAGRPIIRQGEFHDMLAVTCGCG